ncbi:MAG TPA: peptidase M16 [Desulfobulbaceae bacterium]|nr:peptidase M16 [Desulfobulbaceae bacterium]
MKPLFPPQAYRFVIALLAVLVLAGCAAPELPDASRATEQPCISKGWPQDRSDLRPDPALFFGVLANGFRYVIMENHEPEDRVGLYLNIQAGSLHETDEQRGYAHFLEHMLFNGTTHYPPGTLVEYFQSIGMSFGADTNAHTGLDETVYNILLPDGTAKHLEEGLLVMADYARGALLLEEEVNRERGIILAEKRTRDSAAYRVYEKQMRASFAGTRVAERMPIGTEEALTRADASMLRSFYDAWYRPENMILVIVGAVDVQSAAKLVARQFSHLSAPPAQPLCFEYGEVDEEATTVLSMHEPELGKTEVSISARWNTKPRNDSLAWQFEEVKRHVVATLMNNRLKRLVSQPGSPLTKATNYSGIFLGRFGYASLTATTDGEKWRPALALLNTALRQALEEGFSERELAQAKKKIMAALEKNIQTEDGRDSRKLAGQIIDKLNRNEVFLSPQQDMELFAPVISGLALSEANSLFRSLWAPAGREIMIAGTARIAPTEGTAEDLVLATFNESQQQEIAPWDGGDQLAFPYLATPDQGVPAARREYLADIDAERVQFGNGTVLNIKATDFQPNQVLIAAQFGQGRLAEPLPGLGMLAEAVVRESGVGGLTRAELDEALAGRTVEVTFRVGQESFSLNGAGLAGEMELLFQLITTQLRDPAFREEAYQLSRERFGQMYDQMESSVDGALQLQGERFLVGGNARYGMPPREEFMLLALSEVQAWLSPHFVQGPLELTVVGDVHPDEVVALAGRYLATLERTPAPAPIRESLTFPAGKELEVRVPTAIDKALVVLAWPTDDFWDIFLTRRLNILSAVLDDRLRLEIREKLGAAYSTTVYNLPSRVAPGYGALRAMLTVDPTRAGELAEHVVALATELREKGVQEEELRRSLGPSLTSIKDMMKTNRYWLESVLTLSSRHPEQLAWPLTIERDFAAITAAEISALAARYLQPGAAAKIVFRPAHAKEPRAR